MVPRRFPAGSPGTDDLALVAESPKVPREGRKGVFRTVSYGTPWVADPDAGEL